MILVTGGTGFIGKHLIRHLVEQGHEVRTLIRPSASSPDLPLGVPVEVAVSGLTDERGLRAAMVGVDTIYHLAGGEWRGPRASLLEIDIQGTRAVIAAAREAGVQRIFYLSHLGAERSSAYPLLRTKGIAEEFIRRSGLEYTILRSAIVFGPEDGLTTGLARILIALPFFLLIPGNGRTLLQPIWVEDLVTCLSWSLDEPETRNRTIDVGGPEYLSFEQVVKLVMRETGLRRKLIPTSPPLLRSLTVVLEAFFPALPVSVYWLDYLAVNRTTSLDTLPRLFNILPSRMTNRLDYLGGQNWRRSLMRRITKRRKP